MLYVVAMLIATTSSLNKFEINNNHISGKSRLLVSKGRATTAGDVGGMLQPEVCYSSSLSVLVSHNMFTTICFTQK